MAKLIIRNGFDSDKVFELNNGVYTIGRGENNAIHINSPSISKEHAKLTVNGPQIKIEDLNSANGTFVNGILITRHTLRGGDRINLHESTLELITDETPFQQNFSVSQPLPPHLKLLSLIKKHLLPLFYGMLETIEYRILFGILFFIFVISSVILTIAPLSTQSKKFLQTEARKQAQFITKQLAEENRRGVYLKNEVILSTKVAESEERVISASVVDKTGRIMAPASRMNLNLSEPQAIEALKHEDTFVKELGSDRILVSEPIKIFSQVEGKNIVGAYAQTIYSLRGIGLSNAGITRIFLNSITWALILGILFYFLLIRITLRPLEVLANDIEQNASAGFKKLNRRFKFKALDEVLRKVNSAFWKLKSGSAPEELETTEENDAGDDIIFQIEKEEEK